MTKKIINRILIANRGEIARRIIRTCNKMGIESVSLFTSEEANAAWVKEASHSISLGNGSLNETYLNIDKIIEIAKSQHCNAIHPGYGFLAENAAFAKACIVNEITFIGPSHDLIELMGNKLKAREFVAKVNIPLPLGLTGSAQEIITQKDKLAFPLIIKAAAGGGGKGMQIVRSSNELKAKLEQASKEATMWFGNGEVFVEQYFENARHIEVQVLSDSHGNHLHLFERECTLQRNYQKVIEEAPSPTLNEEQRKAICNAATQITKATNYTNAGTIEFLWENGQFYFLEMNTRIQVEHPVTEAITGIDLIEQQINIAANKELSFKQDEISISGHAIEARIYAEQAHLKFKPSAGYMHLYQEANSLPLRFDSSYAEAGEISTAFDGLITKVIAHQNNRHQAIELLKEGISKTLIHGVHHNGNFLNKLLIHKLYLENKIHTKFIEQHFDELCSINTNEEIKPILFAAIVSLEQNKTQDIYNIWNENHSIENIKNYRFITDSETHEIKTERQEQHLNLIYNDVLFTFSGISINNNHIQLVFNETPKDIYISKGESEYWIQYENEVYLVKSQNKLPYISIQKKESVENKKDYFEITSPLHGKVSSIFIKLNQFVKQGEPLLSIESMKTDNQIVCPADGLVENIFIENNKNVKENQLLISFKN